MFKIGDKVKLVGGPAWNERIKKDIGLIGVVIDTNKDFTHISLSQSISGNVYWNIIGHLGIELYIKPGTQLEFDW